MMTKLQRSFSTLLACLLVLATLTAAADSNRAQAAPGAPSPAQTAPEPIPDGLMSALLAASAQPLTAGGYREYKVFASDEAHDHFGISVALSDDGNTALVGAYYADVGANLAQGAAYVFARSGTAWDVQQQLTASDGAAVDRFGVSVALSADGNTALVGADRDDVGGNTDQGSAYVFVRSGDAWSEQAHLIAADGATDAYLGIAVALSGETALVGAPYHTVGANQHQGAAYVFVRSGANWSWQQTLTASDGYWYDHLGNSVALSGDTALVGAHDDDVGANNDQGSAYVFVRSGTTWAQQKQLTASDGAEGDEFGYAVALSGDTAVVGAPDDDTTLHTDQGAVYAFARSGTTWTNQQKMGASSGADNDRFGSSVAISSDRKILAGAPGRDVGANAGQGAVYVFTVISGHWSSTALWTATDGAGDSFGCAVALSGDGSTAMVGASGDDLGANINQGSTTVFAYDPPFWDLQQRLTAPGDAVNDNFGLTVAISGDTALVGAYNDDVGGNADQGSAYVFVRNGMAWDLQQKLTASDGAATDLFGYAVALAGDTALVGAHADDVDAKANQGSAYVFARSGTTWTEQDQLVASDGLADDNLGISVALAADGNTAMVGAFLDDVTAANQGSVYVYTRSDSTWTQRQRLVAPDAAADDQFGRSVAISGSTALVGAPRHKVDSNALQGTAYVFVHSASWNYAAQLTADDGEAQDQFGFSVALSGGTALVGAYADDVGLPANDDQGSAYVLTGGGSTWTQQAQLTASDGEDDDFFGRSVAIEGDTALVGAHDDSVGANPDQGSAYVFTRSGSTWTQQAQLTASDGAADDLFGVAAALSGDTLLVGAYWDDIGENDNQGSAYFYELVSRVYLPLVLRGY